MKFRWESLGGGIPRPLLRVGFRRNGALVPVDLFLLVDTGADGLILPLPYAALMGFQAADLEQESCQSAGGIMVLWKPKGPIGVDANIGGFWVALPTLKFGEHTPPLLGRDAIFAHFDLRMIDGETELRPKK